MPKKFDPALKERAVRFPHRSGPAGPTRARSPSRFRTLALTTSQALDTEPSSGACSATNRPGATSEDNVAVRDLKAKVRRLEEEKRDPAFCGDFLRGGARPPAASTAAKDSIGKLLGCRSSEWDDCSYKGREIKVTEDLSGLEMSVS